MTRFDEDRDATGLGCEVLPPLLLAWAASSAWTSRWCPCAMADALGLLRPERAHLPNWRLVLMPDWVRDYVIVHELMLRRMDHSPRFWRYVADAYPRWREARGWLRTNGAGLR